MHYRTRHPGWLTLEDKYLPASFPVAQLLDLIPEDDVASQKVLRGTGIFMEDIQAPGARLSIKQLSALVSNIARLFPRQEMAARWGARMWPGFAGAFSQALAAADHLECFLDLLCRFHHWLTPGISPVVMQSEDQCVVFWQNMSGLPDSAAEFLMESYMTALVAITREQLPDVIDPWRCFVSSKDKGLLTRMAVYCADDTSGGVGGNFMVIPRRLSLRPWAGASVRLREMATRQAMALTAGVSNQTFTEAVAEWQATQRPRLPTLDDAAQYFAISTATLKRYLANDGVRYQVLGDQLRLRLSLYLMFIEGCSNEDIALRLGMGDGANFRRAFRRWTGSLPSDVRTALGALDDVGAGYSSPNSEQSIKSQRQ